MCYLWGKQWRCRAFPPCRPSWEPGAPGSRQECPVAWEQQHEALATVWTITFINFGTDSERSDEQYSFRVVGYYVCANLFFRNEIMSDSDLENAFLWGLTCTFFFGLTSFSPETGRDLRTLHRDYHGRKDTKDIVESLMTLTMYSAIELSLIHIWRCRRDVLCRSRWSPYH